MRDRHGIGYCDDATALAAVRPGIRDAVAARLSVKPVAASQQLALVDEVARMVDEEGYADQVTVQYGPAGVRVNSVAPGAIVTAMWERNRSVDGVIEQIEAQTALRRWGVPEDVADVVVFLASDAARYVTAQTIEVDGGMASTLDLYGGSV